MILVMLKIFPRRQLWLGRSFSDKIPRASDGAVGPQKHINQAQQKFRMLMKWEVVPIVLGSISAIFCY